MEEQATQTDFKKEKKRNANPLKMRIRKIMRIGEKVRISIYRLLRVKKQIMSSVYFLYVLNVYIFKMV